MKKHNDIDGENPFSMSTGDLMAALLFVFVLLLAAAMLMINRTNAKIEAANQEYEDSRRSIILGLKDELTEEQLIDWGAELDTSTITIRFQKDVEFFTQGKADIKPEFKKTLSDFYPSYLSVLSKYQDKIAEVRIEGHTSSEHSDPNPFIANMKLSQDRARSVFEYCERLTPEEHQSWLHEKVTANGLSSSHLIYDEFGKEDSIKSRRVEFRILPKSEAYIEKIHDALNNR